VVGLVLVGSATEARRLAGVAELKRAVDALADPVPAAFTREFQASTVHRPVPPQFLARVSDDSRRLPARVWRALLAAMLAEPPAAGLRAFGAPALLLWGERDAYVPRAEQDALLALIPGATLTTYPATGHAPHWERPAAVARDLARFVARVRAAP
jgi:pimeloyl-ACP methyl ester carboxylesterase